jgi:predicted Kef-type K+ transport protein
MTASVHATEQMLFSILIQLIIMIGVARLLNLAFRKMGQPGVIGEIVAGLLLGPSLFGHFFPELSVDLFGAKAAAPIVILSQIGLILLMFQIGSEFEFGHLKTPRNRRAMSIVSFVSIIVPFGLGFAIGQVSQPVLAPGIDPLVYSLFTGVALAITAVPILGRILREFGLTRDEMGVVAISAAAVNDVVGWVHAGLHLGLCGIAILDRPHADPTGRSGGSGRGAVVCAAARRRLADEALPDRGRAGAPDADGHRHRPDLRAGHRNIQAEHLRDLRRLRGGPAVPPA